MSDNGFELSIRLSLAVASAFLVVALDLLGVFQPIDRTVFEVWARLGGSALSGKEVRYLVPAARVAVTLAVCAVVFASSLFMPSPWKAVTPVSLLVLLPLLSYALLSTAAVQLGLSGPWLGVLLTFGSLVESRIPLPNAITLENVTARVLESEQANESEWATRTEFARIRDPDRDEIIKFVHASSETCRAG
jgi:hypothetical protein